MVVSNVDICRAANRIVPGPIAQIDGSLISGDRQSAIAPGKLNLTLSVLGKRPDGYHELESVVVKITLYDGIDAFDCGGPPIQITCTDPAIPTDARNTVWRAASLLRRQAGQPAPLHIQLHKRIPIAAGLGGGSSDAAAVLRLLNQRWQVGLSDAQLRELGSEIGSDVPLFLTPGPVVIGGRGQQVEPVHLPWCGWLVLVLPPFGIATAEVYRAWDGRGHNPGAARQCLDARCHSAAALTGALFNDLEACAGRVEPRLRELKQGLEANTRYRFHVTGSGSTLFACLDSHDEAEQLNRRIAPTCGVTSQVVRVISNTDCE